VTRDAEHADVLIIGAGTSGGVVARHLAEAGMSVVCLEQGDWVDERTLVSDMVEYELAGAKQWHPNPNVRGGAEDYGCDLSESDWAVWMYNGVGGSSVMYGAIWSRFAPSDFRTRSLDAVGDDWPLSYDDLEPYYEAIDREMSVSGLGGNPAYPPGAPPPLPPHPIRRTGRTMAAGMNKLGWHWWPPNLAIPPAAAYDGSRGPSYSTRYAGDPDAAKSSTHVTHWPQALEHGARIVTGARVARITTDGRGLATGAIYLDRQGTERFQAASLVVLAANGIGTPRLLLLSASSRFPDGLANSSGLVGKRLMLHPFTTVVGQYEDDLADWVGPAGEHIQSMQFYETDPSRGFARGCKWILQGATGPLQAIGRWANRSGVRFEELWGDGFAQRLAESVGHQMQWAIVPEDLPDERNHVALDAVLKDSSGLPAPKIVYRISENTERMLAFHRARAHEAHEAAGATRTWVVEHDMASGLGQMGGHAHLMGTACMGDDQQTSVVDRHGCAHDVPNLYIVDASVFVTSSGVNPTATTCALAKRSAAHIARHARLQAVPA
jgi:choline dehydrogenase-like flavoprotein